MNARLRAVVLLGLALVVVRVWTAPQSLAGASDAAAQFRFRGDDGREHVLLGDLDSYLWLRLAQNYLRTGTVCDEVTDGACRDRHTNAPLGVEMKYARSLHVAAIVGLHRVLTTFSPGFPLESTAFLVPTCVAVLMLLPAFALGRRLAGELGGGVAALLVTTNPTVLGRSLGSDDDVWNVALPVALAWATTAALAVRTTRTRVGFAVVAGAIVGLHAAVWRGWPFTWLVALSACAAMMCLHAARGRAVAARATALVAIVLWGASGVATTLAGADEPYLALPLRLLGVASAPIVTTGGSAHWPDVFATVAELQHPWRQVIAEGMGGPAFFLLGWLGLLVLLLPRRGWEPPHFVVLIGGTLLYRYLVVAPEIGAAALVATLAIPPAAALALRLRRGGIDDDPADGGALLVALWLLAALHLANGASRFIFLLAAPSGLAIAAAVGRAYGWAMDAMAEMRWRQACGAALLVAASGVVAVPIARGWTAANNYLPLIHSAWRDALISLRDTTPPNAIVFTWWDYGYWTEWFADRRVPADGASLRTHVPYWVARALAATTPRESLGILRMLACGSDTTPEPEGQRGAVGRLIAAGIDELDAHDLVLALTRVDRRAAALLLDRRGLDATTRDGVLAATHCEPPPSYLVLSSAQIEKPGWALLGTWDVHTGTRPGDTNTITDWLPCRRRGEDLDCPGFIYRGLDPARSRFGEVSDASSAGTPPAAVLLVGPHGIEQVAGSTAGRVGVLVDAAHDRVSVGAPALLRATYVQLVLADGRFAPDFERIDARTGFGDERISVWRIRWPADS